MIQKNNTKKSSEEKGSRSTWIPKAVALMIALWLVASLPAMAAAGGFAPDASEEDRATGSGVGEIIDTTPQVETQQTTAGGENGTVFVHEDNSTSPSHLKAIDAATGSVDWRLNVGDPGGTPIVYGGDIYAVNNSGYLFSINAVSGAVNWEQEATQDFFVRQGPTIYNGSIYIGDSSSNLLSLDLETGIEEWNYSANGGVEPAAHVSDGIVYISDGNSVTALSADSGDVEWSTDVGERVGPSSPTTSEGMVYVAADTSLFGLDTETGEIEVSTDVGESGMESSPVVHEENVFFGGTSGAAYAADKTTGQLQWAQSTGTQHFGSMTVENGIVYTSGSVNLIGFDPETGEAVLSDAEGSSTSPTSRNGVIYAVGDQNVRTFAYDIESESEIWSVSGGDLIQDSPTFVPPGSDNSGGSRTNLKVENHHDRIDSDTITGTVIDQDGNPLENASVQTEDNRYSTSTDESGDFTLIVSEGTYTIEISHPKYRTYTEEGVESGTYMGEIRLEGKRLELDVAKRMEPNSDRSYPYQVWWWDDNGNRNDVTTNAAVASNNTTIATVDDSNFEIIPQDGVNATVEITATYNATDGETYNATMEVAVAEATVENLPLLPAAWRISALLSNSQIQSILVATFAAIIGTWFATSFAGLGAFQLVMVVGWFADYVEIGIVMLSLFTALFIGFNLAANIDYTVRR